jgi:hypothetical protein
MSAHPLKVVSLARCVTTGRIEELPRCRHVESGDVSMTRTAHLVDSPYRYLRYENEDVSGRMGLEGLDGTKLR